MPRVRKQAAHARAVRRGGAARPAGFPCSVHRSTLPTPPHQVEQDQVELSVQYRVLHDDVYREGRLLLCFCCCFCLRASVCPVCRWRALKIIEHYVQTIQLNVAGDLHACLEVQEAAVKTAMRCCAEVQRRAARTLPPPQCRQKTSPLLRINPATALPSL